MAKLNCIGRASSLIFSIHTTKLHSNPFNSQSLFLNSYSTTKTPFPLQYEMIITRSPPPPPPPHHHCRRPPLPKSTPHDSQLGFDDWVDMKLTTQNQDSHSQSQNQESQSESQEPVLMDKSKRKYYNKRERRMYGSDSEDENNGKNGVNKFVELKQEVVKLKTLHKREEELYFYDTFAYPWEKDKHYKMVYQLEKKYFPDQCFDKAFLEPGQQPISNSNVNASKKKDEKSLVFFEEENGIEKDAKKDVKMDVTEKKVEEFFKCLKKVPNEIDDTLPFISSRSSGLPPKWDGPTGAVLLINKPKG